MSAEKSPNHDDYLASMLAKIDEAIARGEYSHDNSLPDESTLDSLVDDPRLQRAADVLKMLDAMRPDPTAQASPSLAASSTDDPNRTGKAPPVDTRPITDGQKGSTRETGAKASGKSYDPISDEAPSEIGRFQIIRPLGQGGFGMVFLARDPGLKRFVALKIPRPQALFNDELRQRFIKEGQAAASLNHANIVPVFEAGRAGAVVYLASSYCAGVDLLAWRRHHDSGTEQRIVATWMRQLAEGIQHAHLRGILHRDLKPGNILITRHSVPSHDSSASQEEVEQELFATDTEDLKPLVTDFGLAKQMDVTDESMTDGILGTPNYMSPEQARGAQEEIGIESDIYSLGAVMYYMLTGCPPFENKSTLELLNAVQRENPPRISSSQQEVSPDLEAICMKCLEKEPHRRYRSASELADDLQRFLNHEPVRARTVTSRARFAKWCRRNPLVATLSIAVAVSLFVALTASVSGWIVSNQALQRESTSRAEAELARSDADRRYRDAWMAVDDFFVTISEDRLLNTPGMQPLREELLGRALVYYQKFLHEREDDEELQLEVAIAHARVGLVKLAIDSVDDAQVEFEAAIKIAEPLSRYESPDNEAMRVLAEALEGLASIHMKRFEFVEAVDLLDRALLECRRLPLDAKAHPLHHKTLTSILNNLGLASRRAGNIEKAKSSYEESAEVSLELCEAYPDNIQYRLKEFGARGNLAILYRNELGQPDRALDTHIQLVEDHEALMKTDPDSPDLLESYAQTRANTGLPLFFQGKVEEAFPHVRAAADSFDRLILMNPKVVRYQHAAATIRNPLGTCWQDLGEFDKAKAAYAEGREMLVRLVRDNPEIKEARLDLAGLLMNTAVMHSKLEEFDDARASFTEALSYADELRKINPQDFVSQLVHAQCLQNWAQIEAAAGDFDFAAERSNDAVAAFEEMNKTFGRANQVQKGMRDNLSNRALYLEELDRFEEALSDRQRAMEFAPPTLLARYELLFGICSLKCEQLRGVSEIVEKYQQALPQGANDLFRLARLEGRFAIALQRVMDESGDPTTEQVQRINALKSTALEHLVVAQEKGAFQNTRNVEQLLEEGEFQLLEDDPTFEKLLASIESDQASD